MSFFENCIKNGNLAHAYCFVGRDQTGKRTMANYVAAKLLAVEAAKLSSHTDYYYVERQVNEKTGKLNQDISVAQARQFKEFANRRAWMGGYKVGIIDEAEKLNKESGNALLRVLEESAGRSVFFLLTADDTGLLPTIRSRCQVFYFAPAPAEEIRAGLAEAGYGERAAMAAKLALGKPGLAIDLAENEERLNGWLGEVKRWEEIIGRPVYERMKKMENLLEKDEKGLNKDRMNEVLEIWQTLWREVMLGKRPGPAACQAAAIIDSIGQTRALLRQNVNQRLAVEQLLLNW